LYGKYPAGYEPKRQMTAILFWAFLGLLGGHRFYVGKIKTGILMLITLGGLGIWWIIDLFVILAGGLRDKNGYELK
jgi:TM2 domain-containing membrane protein YozV